MVRSEIVQTNSRVEVRLIDDDIPSRKERTEGAQGEGGEMKSRLSLYRIHCGILWRDKNCGLREKIAGSWTLFVRIVLLGLLAKMPRMIWPMDACEVLVTFDLSKVSLEQLFKVEEALSELGVSFDTGSGCGKRD